MANRSRDIFEDELITGRPAPAGDCDSPTVEPLKIFRTASRQSSQDRSLERFQHPPPPLSSSLGPARPPSFLAALPPLPSFPLPPDASSSAAPLPYPDGDWLPQPSTCSRPPYPADTHRPVPANRIFTGPLGASSYNDTSPRLDLSLSDEQGGLAERRGTAPIPLQRPQSPADDYEGLFAKPLRHQQAAAEKMSKAYQQKPYYPALGSPSKDDGRDSSHSNVNRFASTASTSTTRANRGSPPPPETPVYELGTGPQSFGGGIEARYAASGIPGSATLTSLQAPSAAAHSRLAQYGRQPTHMHIPRPPRPWTPTENPENQPHGPPTVYQGSEAVASPQVFGLNLATTSNSGSNGPNGTSLQVSVLEQDFARMQASTPPPAYTSVNLGGNSQGYAAEKQRPQQSASGSSITLTTHSSPASGPGPSADASASAHGSRPSGSSSTPEPSEVNSQKQAPTAAGLVSPTSHLEGHPAFSNDTQKSEEAQQNGNAHSLTHTPSLLASVSSPPPLPEGWIAHLDQNSGQYYYIHLATQATQWEFPQGPNPMHHDQAPLSPVGSTYGNPSVPPYLGGGKQPLASPMFAPQTPGYAESIMSVAASATPSAAGFTGPPGLEMFRIAPTNGVYFGPYLRYGNMNMEKGHWMGSIMIVTDGPQPPTIHVHLSMDLSPNPRQLVPHPIFTHQNWTFYKYDMALLMSDNGTERWTYAVTSHLGCTRYEFVVAGRQETGWRTIAHSNNDFAPSTSQNDRAKVGGIGFMWKDVLQKNVECGGFHVQLGLGNQIYGDRLWKEVPLLKQWLAMQGRENRKNVQWTARHEEDVSHAYFHYYTSHFDQPFLREAFAQIPHVLQIDDHDIFDGFGSYPEYMQQSQIFKNIGRLAIEMYLLFQHHTTVEMLRIVKSDWDLFTITGHGWHFVKYLGPAVVVVGPDCRSERTQTRVMAGPTYQGVFPKVAMLPPSVQHCIWMISVPVVYPRLDTVETLANTFATGKKAVNTTYNILGRVTSSVAGVVGGKEVVASGFSHVKKAVGKSGLMGSVLNQFGEFDLAEPLKDLWTHESKDLERTYLIRTLQGIAQQKGIRMTFLSGDVNTCGAGLFHDPSHPSDHKTMYQIISSPIVAAPAGPYLLKLLHNDRMLYVPTNGHKSTHEVCDTKEDMMEIFHTDASGTVREHKKLMGRRNYVSIVAYDPDTMGGGMGGTQSNYTASIASRNSGATQKGLRNLSLAVDFVVQGDGGFTAPTKYGPVIIPHLGFGQ